MTLTCTQTVRQADTQTHEFRRAYLCVALQDRCELEFIDETLTNIVGVKLGQHVTHTALVLLGKHVHVLKHRHTRESINENAYLALSHTCRASENTLERRHSVCKSKRMSAQNGRYAHLNFVHSLELVAHRLGEVRLQLTATEILQSQ
jgi:hypothetical protein